MQGIHIKNASGKTGSLVNSDLNLEDTVVDISKIVTTDVSEAALGKMGKNFTANATFTAIDNKIVMAGIVTALGLEVGDVIVFSNAIAQNNKPRTVESITDANTIVVNYEHCGSRGNGSLKLTDETVSGASVKLLAKWFVAPVGLGQAWVDTAASRAVKTTYTNTTVRTSMVNVIATNTATTGGLGISIYVNGELFDDKVVFTTSPASVLSVSAVIPSGSTYLLGEITAGDTIYKWMELR